MLSAKQNITGNYSRALGILRFLLFLGAFLISFIGETDTLDHWQVSYNDSIIGKYNALSTELLIVIPQTQISKNDTLTINYSACAQCVDCDYILFIRDEKKNKVQITQTKTKAGDLSFNMNELLQQSIDLQSEHLDFFYWEWDHRGDISPMSKILRIEFKP